MKFIELYTGDDKKSHFREITKTTEFTTPLGHFSQKFNVNALFFRKFSAGLIYDWHNAPQKQYIIYLRGSVEVEVGSGKKYVFNPGDVLLANDLTGGGHISRTLQAGEAVVITESEPVGENLS